MKKQRGIGPVLVMAGLYALLFAALTYFSYKLIIQPARERVPSTMQRSAILPQEPSTLASLRISTVTLAPKRALPG
jgi:hypothetical protein